MILIVWLLVTGVAKVLGEVTGLGRYNRRSAAAALPDHARRALAARLVRLPAGMYSPTFQSNFNLNLPIFPSIYRAVCPSINCVCQSFNSLKTFARSFVKHWNM